MNNSYANQKNMKIDKLKEMKWFVKEKRKIHTS